MPTGKVSGSKFFGEERYQQYVEELTAEGTIDGEQLSPEERKEGFKKRNDKIGFQDFVDKVLDKKQSATVSKGPTALPGGGGGGALIKRPSNGGLEKADISKAVPQEGSNILEEILKIVTSIRDTLIKQNELDKDRAKSDKQSTERTKRAKKEKGLESNIFKGLAKTAGKILKPVKGLFQRVFEFFSTILLGRIVMKILEWMGDKENKKKVDSLIRFLGDFFPAIATAFILFGTKFGGLIRLLGGWAIQILRFAVPKLLTFIARKPKAAAALAVVGGVGMLGARILTGTEVDGSEDAGSSTSNEETKAQENFTAAQTKATESLEEAEEPEEMSKGGTVPGSGNKDTVPAMLTPGEFVMSKGAVNKFGRSTLESMNTMGGGSGIPSFSDGIMYANNGGEVPGGDEDKDRPKFDPGAAMKMLSETYGTDPPPEMRTPKISVAAVTGKDKKDEPSGSTLSETQQKALQVLAKYESGAAGYDAVNQIGTKGGRGVEGFSGDIKKMSQHKGRSLTDFTVGEIKALQHDDKSLSNSEWIKSGKLHAVGAYQFIGNTLPGVAARAGIPDDAKFSPAVQDLMALQLMKERGISPWVGPSDKATAAERAIVEAARSEPIAYDKTSGAGAITAFGGGGGGSYTSPSSGGGGSGGSSTDTSSIKVSDMKAFDFRAVRKALGVKTGSVSKSSRPSSSTMAYQQAQQAQAQGDGSGMTGQGEAPGIPQFDAAAMSSTKKIKVLGITV